MTDTTRRDPLRHRHLDYRFSIDRSFHERSRNHWLQAPTRHLNRWWYVATGFLTLLFGTSTVNVLFNILGKPMTEEFGWDRSVIANGLSVETVMVGISIVILGFLIDRFGPKVPSVPMALTFGIGLMLMAALPNNEMLFFALCIVIGAGAGA
ncbi:hypothetical protein NJ76_28640 [Rhodococcus sp. IITR03]|nr:hypothetical protein NJ76_28640 [Rhodococcus sp. IITR03]